MPIYSYKCNNCGKIFEKFEKSGNVDKVFCSNCGSEALRIFSPAGIVFKGKGFYSTDYGSKSSSIATKNNVNKEATEETKTETSLKETKSDNAKEKEVKTQNK
ncbi:MAG: zinc ribbon domain-containing protein [Actinobacteria bacterium]|nr:zinc ribbon domain-containing protein [Actinomycetota bacterium]